MPEDAGSGTPPQNTSQGTPANPTGTTSATQVMMGLAQALTPKITGAVIIIVSGTIANSLATGGISVQIRHGTGTAPVNGAAAAGTADGASISVTTDYVAADTIPFCLVAIVTGLTLGTAYWFDLGLAALTAGTASASSISYCIAEVP